MKKVGGRRKIGDLRSLTGVGWMKWPITAFTLVEVLVAISIFTIAALISTRILVDVVQLQKKSSIQNGLYEDARTILQQISKEIQNGTVDYEEYYNIEVIKSSYYGTNYGVYASRFFDPGKSLYGATTINPDDLGIECSQLSGSDCEVYYNFSSDFNTGQNPYKKDGNDAKAANALCDSNATTCGAISNDMKELYLIDSSGTKKTIIGRKKMNDDDFAIGLLRMEGSDYDQNGVIDIFKCTVNFKCEESSATLKTVIKYPFVQKMDDTSWSTYVKNNAFSLPKTSDLETIFDLNSSQFIPITPKRTTVKSLQFIINPVEDPYKAYSETSLQTQPSVTILLTVNLSKEVAADYPGKFEDFTIQATVAAGVLGKIDSYPPVNDVLPGKTDVSWIKSVLPSGVNK